MKKNKLAAFIATLTLVGILTVAFFAFTPYAKKDKSKPVTKEDQVNCPTSCSTILTDCYGGFGCTLPGCSGLWKIPNANMSLGAKSVSFSQLAICYVPSATPPWSSFMQIGKIMNTAYRPFSTKVINATASTGATVQCTIYANGDWYIQLTSGTWPGRGTMLSGSYML